MTAILAGQRTSHAECAVSIIPDGAYFYRVSCVCVELDSTVATPARALALVVDHDESVHGEL